ncbi:glycosyltransferase family 2 protein [Cobetia sp. D5]|uniref:glycosyltransferase family 2 protein n=1 Tax=Cobetia sp. D5 TaxID=3105867 RepID=UPI002D79995C|nr:glycosyltransferase family 2 protein [Cobetia sp. D5]
MIVIPMAGLSSRFRKEGFQLPKYMLEANGKSLFEHSLLSFEKYFSTERFLFVALHFEGVEDFIRNKCHLLNIIDYRIVILSKPTRGQAETVYYGLKESNIETDDPILIFNIDTFRLGYSKPVMFDITAVDGYLETFVGEGKNWSNVLPESSESDKVKLTAEKQEISQYCCTGLYVFNSASLFVSLFEEIKSSSQADMQGGEFYVAPMYNSLIASGGDVRFTVIDKEDVIFCGVPEEYYQFKNSGIQKKACNSDSGE